jgi:hypothetical protein
MKATEATKATKTMKPRVPVRLPSDEEISKAFEVLSAQETHWYQLLYFNGLTSPGGNPVVVERGYWTAGSTRNVQSVINIYPNPSLKLIQDKVPLLLHPDAREAQALIIAKGLGFTIRHDDTDEGVLEKVEMMMEGLDKPVREYACCGLAEPRNCVCVASFECPLHGTRCTGSHD